MPNSTPKLVALTIGLFSLCNFSSAMASWGGFSDCNKAAIKMNQACHFDLRDNLITTLANCTNLAERSDVKRCRQQAKRASREDAEVCGDQLEARKDACAILDEERYDSDPLLDPSIGFVDPDAVDVNSANPYVSIVKGHTHVVREGEDEIIVVHVTPLKREIEGVPCRIVVDVALEKAVSEVDGSVEYIPVEVTDDWIAQDLDGNVYYCGELSRNFEEGILRDLDGSFEAGRDFAKAGTLMMANPLIGSAHRQEFSLGEAEDIIQYFDDSANPDAENEIFPCTDADGCLMTHDFTPLEPNATEFKYYIPGVGFVLAEKLLDGERTGERATLACTGDSLDVLRQQTCGIDNPEALVATLCKAAPEAFCE